KEYQYKRDQKDWLGIESDSNQCHCTQQKEKCNGSLPSGPISNGPQMFIIFLGARILWGISFSFIRQAGIMTAVNSGSEIHLGERMGYYRGINAMWRTSGVILGGLSHDVFGFTITLVGLSVLSLVAAPLGALSQKGLKRLKKPPAKVVPGKGDVRVIRCGFAVGLVGGGMLI
ncbi:unnamed protein product, partial [marine sediment metagenome]